MEKKDLIVLGNGFDLNCGLQSSYYIFLRVKITLFKPMADFLKGLNNLDLSTWDRWFGMPYDDIIKLPQLDSNFTVWDAMFLLILGTNYGLDRRWCDIENLLLNTLTSDYSTPFSWKGVFNVINQTKTSPNHQLNATVPGDGLLEKIMAYWLPVNEEFKKYNDDYYSLDEEDFYSFLLEQLKIFERTFSNHICVISSREDYIPKAKELLAKISNSSKNYFIDSFNYTYFDENTRNIHGRAKEGEPIIFGIDDIKIDNSSLLYRFTKTSRKLELLFYQKNIDWEEMEFKNVYIYGHSLNRADYSYFFQLFNKVGLNNLNNLKTKIIFCYSIYDESQKQEIINELRMNVENLISSYSNYVNNPKLLSRILMGDKIRFKEIV